MNTSDDFDDILTALQTVAAKSRKEPTFVTLFLSFSYRVGRSKLIHSYEDDVCILFEPGTHETDIEASINDQLSSLGCSWLPQPHGLNFRSLAMKPGRFLHMASLQVDTVALKIDHFSDHIKASDTIAPHACAIAAALGQLPKAESSCQRDSDEYPSSSLDDLAEVFIGLMNIRESRIAITDATGAALMPSKSRLGL